MTKAGETGPRGTGAARVLVTRDEVMVESAVVRNLGGPNSGVTGPDSAVGFDRTFPTRKMSKKAGPADFAVFLDGAITGDAKAEGDGFA